VVQLLLNYGQQGGVFKMEEIQITYTYTSDLARQRGYIPKYATGGAAGCDLYACVEAALVLKPGERLLVPTGIAVSLPSAKYAALLFARSGLAAKHGIAMANGVGLIDSDYRGEILCPLVNLGQEDFVITPGLRIAQLVITPVFTARFVQADRLDDTARGEGGFGSTGC
jgi:dUTP pyrophosphatase